MVKKIVILDSGGLDSAIMRHWALANEPDAEITSVYFDIGHPYAWKELAVLPDYVKVHSMPWFYQGEKGKEGNATGNIFIPGRNMVFATIAAGLYCPNEIWLGALQGEIHEQATDKNFTFLELQNELLQYVLSPFQKDIKLRYPFAEAGMGKLEITRWAVEHGLKDLVLKSSSCMSGETGNCGRCAVCVRRAGIFMQLQMSEKYNVDPFMAKENRKMLLEMIDTELKCMQGIETHIHYDLYRREEIIPALCMIHGYEHTVEGMKSLYAAIERSPQW